MESKPFLFNIQKLCILESNIYEILSKIVDCEKIVDSMGDECIDLTDIKRFCELQLKKINNVRNGFFYSMCKHEFIDDCVDICPESSKKITYCVNCGYTK